MSRFKGLKNALKTGYKAVAGEDFFKIIEEVRNNENKLYRANITPYSPEDYSKFKTFLHSDGKSGYAIKPDGELISVFSLEKGRGDDLVKDAVLQGAQKLDAFDMGGKLPKLYGKYFKETDRLKFADEYAPTDWDYEKFGRPDVVMMEIDPKKVKGLAKEVVDSVPTEKAQAQLRKEPTQFQKYMNALEYRYGKPEERAKELFGLDLEKLREMHKKPEALMENVDVVVTPEISAAGTDIGKRIEFYDKKTGKLITDAPFTKQGDNIVVADRHLPQKTDKDALVFTDPEYRRQGYASALYRQAEKEFGVPLKPSKSQTDAGRNLWSVRQKIPLFDPSEELISLKIKASIYKNNLFEQAQKLNPDNPAAAYRNLAENNETLYKLLDEIDRLESKERKSLSPSINRPFGNPRHPEAAFDPRFKDSKNILAGAGAIPFLEEPAKEIKDTILTPAKRGYEKLKSYFTEPLAEELDLTKDKSMKKDLKQQLDLAADPMNLLGGAGALIPLLIEAGDDE